MRIISVLKTNYSLKFKNFCTASQNFAYPTCIHTHVVSSLLMGAVSGWKNGMPISAKA